MIPLKVEVAEAGTVWQVLHGETLTWTDITPWLLFAAGVDFDRGMGAEDDSAKPGQATFTCQTLPDGSVAPLKVRRPVRISGYISDTWQTLWTGSISGWRQGWAAGVRGVQQVVCTDNICVAERIGMESIPVETIMETGPVWCVPLDDTFDGPPRELTGAADTPRFWAREVGAAIDTATLTSGGWSPGSQASAPETSVAQFTADAGGGWCLNAESPGKSMPNLGDGFSVSMFVYLPARGREVVALSMAVTGWPVTALDVGTDPWTWGNTRNLDIGVSAAGYAFARFDGVTRNGATMLQTGVWHHIAVSQSADAGFVMAINGLIEHAATTWSLVGLGSWRIRIGGSLDSTGMFDGWVSCVSAHAPALDQYQVRAIAETRGGMVGETTAARFWRLATLGKVVPPLDSAADLVTETLGNSTGWTTFWSSAGTWTGNTATVASTEIASLTLNDAATIPGGSGIFDATFTLDATAAIVVYVLTGGTETQAQYFADGVAVQEYSGWFDAGTHTLRFLFHIENPAHTYMRASFRVVSPVTCTVTGGGVSVFGGLATMGHQPVAGRSLAAALQQCADAEGAPWGTSTDGLLTLASRADRHNRLAEGVTRTWEQVEADGVTWAELAAVSGGWIAQDVYLPATAVDKSTAAETRDRGIVNRITVTRPGGLSLVVTNETSVEGYGRYGETMTLCVASDAQAQTRAAFEVATKGEPAAAIGALTVDVTACSASLDVAAVLAAQPGHVIQVQDLPPDAPATSLWFFAEGVSDRVDPGTWVRTINTSAVPASTRAMRVGETIDSSIPIGV